MDFKKLKHFFLTKHDKIQALSVIKNSIDNEKDYVKFNKLFYSELKPFQTFYEKFKKGENFISNSYSQLFHGKSPHIFDFKISYFWQFKLIVENCELVNIYLKYKTEYEHKLLIGEFDSAIALLDKIESEVSFSVWTLKNRILVNHLSGLSESNWDLLESLLANKSHYITTAIAKFYSRLIRDDYSVTNYNIDLETSLQSLVDKNTLRQEYAQFFYYHCNFLFYDGYEPSIIFYLEGNASIIDKYETLVRTIELEIINNRNETLIVDSLKEFDDNILDPRIQNILRLYGGMKINPNDEIEIINDFELEEFNNVKSKAEHYLLNINSGNSEIIHIYTLALINLNEDVPNIFAEKSELYRVINSVYKINSKSYEDDTEFLHLLKVAMRHNNAFGLGVFSYIYDELNWSFAPKYIKLSSLESNYFSPILCTRFRDEQLLYNNLKNNFSDDKRLEVVLNIINFIDGSSDINDVADIGLKQGALNFIKGISLFIRESYELSISVFEKVLQNDESYINRKFYSIYFLYLSYLSLNDLFNAIKLYVESYLNNSRFVRKLDEYSILDVIIPNFKDLNRERQTIDLSIFLNLTNQPKIKIKQSIELFLIEKGKVKVTDLFDNISEFERSKLLYFLKNVASVEVLQLFRVFKNLNEVNQERIQICQKILELDPENSKIYNEEIEVLTQKNFVIKVIRDFDEGKIYVNDEKIRKKLLAINKNKLSSKDSIGNEDSYSFEENFNRLLEYSNSFKKKKFSNWIEYLVDNISVGDFILQELKKMFLLIRNDFVYSNEFGLNSYLSTRIRHGTLSNHIRSVFENLNLVTSQDNGVYLTNDYWENRLKLKEELNEILQSNLAEFSKSIDQITANLKDDLIQCKTELNTTKSYALFDYTYTDLELFLLLEEFRGYTLESFIDYSFKLLWERTEVNLSSVNNYLDNIIKDEYLTVLNTLENRIMQLTGNIPTHSLTVNIKRASTEIQNQITSISNWFNRSTNKEIGEYSLRSLAETSFQILKNTNPNVDIELDIIVEGEILVRGNYYQFIIEILKICFENMIKHSKLNGQRIEAKFIARIKDCNLDISVTNSVSSDVDKISIIERLEQVKINWGEKDENIGNEEGSGFPKIKNIITSNFEAKGTWFNYNVVENQVTVNINFDSEKIFI
ncbi:hypothetical protein [Sphingobacterium sp. 1.A.4]|uniref:hypothetical protein n=1 Tax=Sphingobacterium sp. 1.A.4 TaxID=2044603 RepID=UPI000C0BE4CB|nr:hypothetical protein [Sphingobacterium sp. 1.A.4]